MIARNEMDAKQPDNKRIARAALSSLIALSLGACAIPVRSGLVSASIAGTASKTTAYAAPSEDTYDRDALAALLGTLTYADTDVQISPEEVYIESRDGRVIIWHDYEIPTYTDVTEVMQRESRRCIALSVALHGSTIKNTEGGTSPFASITWVLTDGHGNNYFAITDGQGIAYTASRPLELYPQADGFLLSDTIYVAISRRLSGIPPRSGETPLDINGNPIVCEGWLSVPDELWTVGLPEKPEDSDASAYWQDEEIEIEAPAVWYTEFMTEEPAVEETVVPDEEFTPENPWDEDPEWQGGEGEGPTPGEGGEVVPGEGEGGEPVEPSEPVEPTPTEPTGGEEVVDPTVSALAVEATTTAE